MSTEAGAAQDHEDGLILTGHALKQFYAHLPLFKAGLVYNVVRYRERYDRLSALAEQLHAKPEIVALSKTPQLWVFLKGDIEEEIKAFLPVAEALKTELMSSGDVNRPGIPGDSKV